MEALYGDNVKYLVVRTSSGFYRMGSNGEVALYCVRFYPWVSGGTGYTGSLLFLTACESTIPSNF